MFEKVSAARALRRVVGRRHHYRRQLERTSEPDLGGHGNTGHTMRYGKKCTGYLRLFPPTYGKVGRALLRSTFSRNARDAISQLWMLQTDSVAAANLLLSKPLPPRESADHHYCHDYHRQDVGVYGKTFPSLPGELYARVPRWNVAPCAKQGRLAAIVLERGHKFRVYSRISEGISFQGPSWIIRKLIDVSPVLSPKISFTEGLANILH